MIHDRFGQPYGAGFIIILVKGRDDGNMAIYFRPTVATSAPESAPCPEQTLSP